MIATAARGAFFGSLLFLASCSAEKPPECQDPLGCVEIAAGEPVRLGVIQALTGKVGALGREQIRGLELALARRDGRVAGRPVELRVEDTGCQPEGGANAALKIAAEPSIAAVLGTTCSGDAATAADVLSKAGLTMISGNNSAPFLTSLGGRRAPMWREGYFRTAPNEEFSGLAAARFAFERLGVRKVATIDDGDIYTRGLTGGFRQEFERLGGEIVLGGAVNKQDEDMEPILIAVRNSGAELLFFPLFQPEGNRVLRQGRRTPGLENLAFMSDGALIEASFIEDVGADAAGMYFVGPTPPVRTPAVEALEAEYRARYGTTPPTFYYLSAFDAATLLLEAIESCAVARGGSLSLGRQRLRQALRGVANRQGVSGNLTCDEFGDCAAPRFDVLRLDDPRAGIEGLKANAVYSYAPGQ